MVTDRRERRLQRRERARREVRENKGFDPTLSDDDLLEAAKRTQYSGMADTSLREQLLSQKQPGQIASHALTACAVVAAVVAAATATPLLMGGAGVAAIAGLVLKLRSNR